MMYKRLTTIFKTKRIVAVAVGFLLVASFLDPSSSRGCDFPAIYNFGDSNSDTGSVSAVFGRLHPPYGNTFFRKPSGRYSDGRLVIDFIAEKLGLPFLSSYLDALEANLSHGANFAASGSTLQPSNAKLYGAGFNPLSLDVQLLQFEQLKDRTSEIYAEGHGLEITGRLSKPEDFSRALFTLDSGQNDLHYGLETSTVEQVKASIPSLVGQFSLYLEALYKEGARTFWIHNTGPIGCLPYFVVPSPPKPEDADQIGCIKSYNEVAQEFNKQLKDKVSQLRSQLRNARLVYVDIYSAKYALISEAQKHGFIDPLGCCCGHLGDNRVLCWDTPLVVNGTKVSISSCSDPSKYISWDGIHYTEAANRWVANRILEGSFSDPPVPIIGAYH